MPRDGIVLAWVDPVCTLDTNAGLPSLWLGRIDAPPARNIRSASGLDDINASRPVNTSASWISPLTAMSQ